jgi:hypothetical protein
LQDPTEKHLGDVGILDKYEDNNNNNNNNNISVLGIRFTNRGSYYRTRHVVSIAFEFGS